MNSDWNHINLQLLRAFLLVAECRNFRAASERLHLSYSAVSTQIKMLEEQLRVKLLRRTTRSVALTPEGEVLFESAGKIFSELDYAFGRIHDSEEQRLSRISFACSPSVAGNYLPGTLEVLHREYPRITLNVREVSSAEMYGCIRKGEVDFGVGARVDNRDFSFTTVLTDPIYALVPRKLLASGQEAIALRDLVKLPVLMLNSMTVLRQRLEIAFREVGLELNPGHQCFQASTLIALAERGHGTAIIPRSLLRGYKAKTACAVRVVEPELDREIGIVTLQGTVLSPPAQKLADIFSRLMRKDSD